MKKNYSLLAIMLLASVLVFGKTDVAIAAELSQESVLAEKKTETEGTEQEGKEQEETEQEEVKPVSIKKAKVYQKLQKVIFAPQSTSITGSIISNMMLMRSQAQIQTEFI